MENGGYVLIDMDNDDLRYLLAVAQLGSLSSAARRLDVSISTVARRLDALEAALKLRLVDRRTNGVRLTPHGERIAAMAEPLVEQAALIKRTADALHGGDREQPVRVSATEFVVSDVLAPALPDLWQRGGQFPVHLISQAQIVSLASRDAEIAVRMSRPEGNSLIARKLPEIRQGLFASSGYLDGRTASQINLVDTRLLVFDDSYGRIPELDWLGQTGLISAVAMRTASIRAILHAAMAGGGVALLPAPFALRAGLIEIPLPVAIPSRAPWIVCHRDVRRQAGVIKVYDWIIAAFKSAVKP